MTDVEKSPHEEEFQIQKIQVCPPPTPVRKMFVSFVSL